MTRYTKNQLRVMASQGVGAELPPPTPKKKRSQEESDMQRALIGWWHLNHAKFGIPEILLFSIPNGGWRPNPITGKILKAEGLRKGAPDLMLAVPRVRPNWSGSMEAVVATNNNRDYHALFLELKRREGQVTPEQEAFHEMLRAQGYRVEVVRSLIDAINIITSYLAP